MRSMHARVGRSMMARRQVRHSHLLLKTNRPPEERPPEGGLRAGEEARTPDIQLGRLTLYQLSYTRKGTQPPFWDRE